MNWDLFSIIFFYLLLLLIFLKYRSRFTFQGKIIALYKTKLGLKAMDRLAKISPRFMKLLGKLGVLVGFSGMIFIFYFLVKETFKFLIKESVIPPLAPVFPGVAIPGVPTLSFWHWIIAIFFVAVVHEFAHGIFARLYNVKIKSSGFAFMGPILAAFVEPDEAQLNKKSLWKQLSIFAAGPFSNILFGILFILLLSFGTGPLQSNMFEPQGVVIGIVMEDYPMYKFNESVPFVIEELNGIDIVSFETFLSSLENVKPGDNVNIISDKGNFDVVAVENPDNASKGFIGVSSFSEKLILKEKYSSYESWSKVLIWFNLLFFWLFIINVGVGLFNLLPLGPVDGGRMFYVTLQKYLKGKTAKRIFSFVSLFLLLLIVINLWPWVVKLLNFLLQGFMLLF